MRGKCGKMFFFSLFILYFISISLCLAFDVILLFPLVVPHATKKHGKYGKLLLHTRVLFHYKSNFN